MARHSGRARRVTCGVVAAVGLMLAGVADTPGASSETTSGTAVAVDRQMIEADLHLRAGLGLSTDRALIEALYAGGTPNRDMGAAFTRSELDEVQERQSLGGDAATIESYVANRHLEDVFGGTFVDNAAGGRQVALFCDEVAPHRAALIALVPHPARLDVRRCSFSSAHLDDTLAAVSAELLELRAQGLVIQAAWVDVPTNEVIASVSSDVAVARARLGTAFGEVVQVIPAGGLGQLAGGAGVDADTPPFVAGYALLSPLGPCTLGYAVSGYYGATYSLTAGHCDDNGMVAPNDHFNGATKVGNTIGSVVNSAMDALWMYDTSPRSALVYTTFPRSLVVHDTDAGHEQVGYTRCMAGAKSLYHCGTLASTNATVGPRPEYPTVVLTHQRLVDDHALRGDSGAPAWHPLNGYAYASGVIHTSIWVPALDPNSPPTGCPICPYYFRNYYAYTPISVVTSYFGLTLSTG
jgi:hypothetical protein